MIRPPPRFPLFPYTPLSRSPDPAEVTISTAFGYPITDSLGHITLRSVAQPDSTLPSAAAWIQAFPRRGRRQRRVGLRDRAQRSEEHTSELQSQSNLVCRLLL